MRFNLLTELWLPVRRKSGIKDRIAPWQVVGGDDPPESLDAPRPDFQAGLLELLIGLLQTACPPEDDAAWRHWLAAPPAPEDLRRAFVPLEPFFELLGERPLFQQDLELAPKDGVTNPVSALLIPEPTGKTLSDGADHFLKRGRVEALCPACAAMALQTLQAFAPSGGQGHRTGLRGGGPMSTIVRGADLWTTLWNNVRPTPEKDAPQSTADLPGRVFPWAAPTVTSQDGKPFEAAQAHPLHCFWAMPRRIVLLPQEETAACDVCGQQSPVIIRDYSTKNFGYNYGETWVHPLTPYRDQGPGKPVFSVKGKAEITGYQHWMGLVFGNSKDHALKTKPAACVDAFRHKTGTSGCQLMAGGYDMDNMKAVQWCEGQFPILRLPGENDDEWLEFFRVEVEKLVAAANGMRRNLTGALKTALLGEKSKAKADKGVLSEASASVWSHTEAPFYDMVPRLAADLRKDDEAPLVALQEEWFTLLCRTGEDLFRLYALSGNFQPEQAKRAYDAFIDMKKFNWSMRHKILDLPKSQPTKKHAGGNTP